MRDPQNTTARKWAQRSIQTIVRAGLFAATAAVSPAAFANALSLNDFGRLALRCAPSVAPSTLASIASTESGFDPLTIHDNTTGISSAPATRDSAIGIAAKLLAAGHSVDLGIMQINSANMAALGLTLEAAFDPCRSTAVGAAVLASSYTGGNTHARQQAALRVALSEYNTGDPSRGFGNGYVHKVELAARDIVPALDVGVAPPAPVDPSPPAAVPAAPADPNAPPAWDVWRSYDYTAARSRDTQEPARPDSIRDAAVPASAAPGPAAPVAVSAPVQER